MTGEYVLQFHCYGATTVFGGLMMLILPITRLCRAGAIKQYDFDTENENPADLNKVQYQRRGSKIQY